MAVERPGERPGRSLPLRVCLRLFFSLVVTEMKEEDISSALVAKRCRQDAINFNKAQTMKRLLVCLLFPLLGVACWIDVLISFPYSPLFLANVVLSPVLILFSLCLPSSCFFDENTNDSRLEQNRKKSRALSCVTAVVIIFIADVVAVSWAAESIGDAGLGLAMLLLYSPLYALVLGIAFGLHYGRRQASGLRQTVGYVGAITGFPVYLPAIVGLVVALIVYERKKK